jgi:UDP-galactopyranose mutase
MDAPKTVIMREYSAAWSLGDEPYYPVDNTDSKALLYRYQSEAAKITNLVVGGRLGGYKYYDMDKSIEAALNIGINI